ncbi:hypothetical protein [Candidatus Magnetobacterium casense]|uniref:Transposase n=1 Tax=Candidatus Magnetobacterium casense TaxID=1455061 RepID=A0ABS6RVG5_9BACT|nr:hypothetical protein [Candidatus Magnetobacterium casensis]MBV6340345.1 hypothetical protein [Candidatus Magnetobacterium casensis]
MENEKTEACLKELNEVLARHKMLLSPQVLIDSGGVKLAMQLVSQTDKNQERLK